MYIYIYKLHALIERGFSAVIRDVYSLYSYACVEVRERDYKAERRLFACAGAMTRNEIRMNFRSFAVRARDDDGRRNFVAPEA